jgi:hypothetical protein
MLFKGRGISGYPGIVPVVGAAAGKSRLDADPDREKPEEPSKIRDLPKMLGVDRWLKPPNKRAIATPTHSAEQARSP